MPFQNSTKVFFVNYKMLSPVKYCFISLLATFFIINTSSAQNVGINSDGSAPNTNAMLDIVSPATGNGKGLLIPRVTQAQRTTADAGLAGGLLDGSGDLRGGAAHGLMVYQTDGTSGFYYNTSGTPTPNWVRLTWGTDAGQALMDDADATAQRTTLGLGSIATQTVPYTLQNANGTNGQFLQTNGAGAATWATVTVPLTGTNVAVGTGANATTNGVAIGESANANSYGTALGYQANGYDSNVSIGYRANAYTGTGPYSGGVSIGYQSNSYSGAGKYSGGVAIGYTANARHNINENDVGAVAVGFGANSYVKGVAVGWKAAGYNQGSALGYQASGSNNGVAVGYMANGAMGSYSTAIGYRANGGGSNNLTFAKGGYSRCLRYNEEWKGADTIPYNSGTGALSGYNKFGYGQVNFNGTTNDATITEIYLGGSAGKRFTLQDNSAVTFQMLVTGINTNTGDSSGWRAWGVIKRRAGAATTTLVSIDVIESITEGGLTTNPTIDADTTNGSLRFKVTGVAANTVKWNASMTYSEVRE